MTADHGNSYTLFRLPLKCFEVLTSGNELHHILAYVSVGVCRTQATVEDHLHSFHSTRLRDPDLKICTIHFKINSMTIYHHSTFSRLRETTYTFSAFWVNILTWKPSFEKKSRMFHNYFCIGLNFVFLHLKN